MNLGISRCFLIYQANGDILYDNGLVMTQAKQYQLDILDVQDAACDAKYVAVLLEWVFTPEELVNSCVSGRAALPKLDESKLYFVKCVLVKEMSETIRVD
jgi:hypothetical protein